MGEIAKLEKYLGGVVEMKKLPGALFVVDPRKERNAIAEAHKLGIPVVAIADTNCDPDEIDYVIDGELTIVKDRMRVTAGPGEIILIPKGSRIQFSVPERARFIYVTYPADWNK